jgi:hypothetical protein
VAPQSTDATTVPADTTCTTTVVVSAAAASIIAGQILEAVAAEIPAAVAAAVPSATDFTGGVLAVVNAAAAVDTASSLVASGGGTGAMALAFVDNDIGIRLRALCRALRLVESNGKGLHSSNSVLYVSRVWYADTANRQLFTVT